MAVNMGSAVAFLELDTSKFSKGFQSAFNDLKVFGSKTATAEQKIKGLSSSMSTVGSALTKGLTLPLVGVGVVALKAGTDFESAMSQVAATMGTTTNKIQNLSKFAQHMGATTAFSATQAAEGLNVLAQSGLTAEEQMKALPEVLNLAAAGNLSLADSSTYVVGTLKGFGKGMDEAKRVTDLVAKGATMANTDVRGLGTALSSSSATAKSYGQNMDSVTLSLLRLAEQNITGEEAATSLNRAMMDLYTPTSKTKKALDALGVSAYDAQGNARDFNDVVDELNGKLNGMSEEERNAYKNTVFTTYGLQAFNKMTVSSTEKVNDFKEGLKDANDSALKQAQTQLDNLKGDITLFKSALEGAGIVISNVLIPNIRNFIQWITNLVTKFNELSEEQQNFIVKVGIVVAAVGPVLLIFSKLIDTVLKIHSAFKKINKIVKSFKLIMTTVGSAVSAPVVAIIAIIGVLVAAFVTLWKTNEEFRNKMKAIWDELKQVFVDFKNKLEELGIDFGAIADGMKKAWETFCNILAPLFTTTFQTIVDFIKGVLDVIIGLIDVFIGIFTGDFDKAANGVYEIFSGFVDFFSNLFGNIIDLIAGVLDALGFEGAAEKLENFKNVVQEKIEVVKGIVAAFPQFMVGIIQTIISFFTETIPSALSTFVTETVPNALEELKAFLDQLPYMLGYLIGELIALIIQFGQNVLDWIETEVPKMIQNVISFVEELPSKIWNLLLQVVQKVIAWGSQMDAKAQGVSRQFVADFIAYVKELPNKLWEIIKQLPEKVKAIKTTMKQAGKDIITALWEGIKAIASGVLQWVEDFVGKIESFFRGIIDGFNSVKNKGSEANEISKSVNGRHANGLDYVPFNGYVAELHKGERVLTAKENKEYNKRNATGNGGDTFNFYNTKPNPYEYARQMKQAKKELLYGI